MDHLVVRIVFLLACVCLDVCVKYKFECAWMCVCVCTHRMPTVRREGEETPAFCHFNPPYPVTHWSLRSLWAFWQRPKGPNKGTGLSSNAQAHMIDRPPVVSEIFELNHFAFDSDLFQAGSPIVLMEIDYSTVCLPLLYSAMIHSTSTKAQKDISEGFLKHFS